MLSLETRINGILISLVNICNRMVTDDKGNHFYDVKYYYLGEEPYTLNFDVIHNRDDGAEKFLLRVYEKVDKMRRKIKK